MLGINFSRCTPTCIRDFPDVEEPIITNKLMLYFLSESHVYDMPLLSYESLSGAYSLTQ